MSDIFDELSHAISLHAQQQIGEEMPFSIGHVCAYDPASQAVQVVFPGLPVVDLLTGETTGQYAISPWVQLGSQWVGNGWGFQCAPEVGDVVPPFSGTQCAVHQDIRNGVAGLAATLLYNQNASPPDATLLAGEAILKHKSGTSEKFVDDGSLLITCQGGTTVTMDASGNVAIVLGNGLTFSVNGTSDALALVSKLVDAFNAHTHPDPQGGNTGIPNSQWSASTIESALVKVGS